jgi:hypothetical protein
MADIIIQFHATTDEIEGLVMHVVRTESLFVTARWHWPFRAILISESAVSEVLRDPTMDDLVFTTQQPALSGKTSLKFLDDNPGALLLDIGRLTKDGLKESCLSCKSAKEQDVVIWRRVASQLRKKTMAGVTGFDPVSGASSFYRAHRYTEGAKELSTQGIRIRSLGNRIELRL